MTFQLPSRRMLADHMQLKLLEPTALVSAGPKHLGAGARADCFDLAMTSHSWLMHSLVQQCLMLSRTPIFSLEMHSVSHIPYPQRRLLELKCEH
jgi:hypothetical protein